MCGFDVALGRYPVGIQAAHVRWHNRIRRIGVQLRHIRCR